MITNENKSAFSYFIAVLLSTYKKNRITVRNAYPISIILQRIISIITGICFPIIIYYIVFDGHLSETFKKHSNTTDYITYITLGYASFILTFSVLMNVGRALITEYREDTLSILLLSPASRFSYILGVYIEQFFRSLLEFLAILFFGIFFGAKIPIEQFPYFIFFVLLISLASFSISNVVSSIMILTRDTYIVQNTFIAILLIICGITFPINYLLKILQFVGMTFPLTPALTAFRNCVIEHQPIYENMHLILLAIASSILFILFGGYMFKKMEKNILQEIYS